MNTEINEALQTTIKSLSEKYPGQDIGLIIARNLTQERGVRIRQSEVDHFKKLAISSLGTDNEIKFDDAERGFLAAALADGNAGFKEFIESIPVEAPLCDDGTKMLNRGYEKKT
jgi:hypothetical protein